MNRVEEEVFDKERALDKTKFWYAVCKAGHSFWGGRFHDNYDAAASDATARDADVHAGMSTAVVLSC